MVYAAETIIMGGGVVDIDHRLSSLAQFQPVAQVDGPLWFGETMVNAVLPYIEELLEVAEGECRGVDAPFR